ncbi:hypothetical protein IKQ26_00470 [bacterium]|nr:hypothetical protein [bacterium]
MKHFLRTLETRINKTCEKMIIQDNNNFIDNRYSSPLTNPFFNKKSKTIIWIEKK